MTGSINWSEKNFPPAPFRHESDTSREAAKTLTTAQARRQALLDILARNGMDGITIDEFAKHLSVAPNDISGRFTELEAVGKICKTPMRRKTRSGKAAVVYLIGKWTDYMQTDAQPPSRPEAAPSRLAEYKALQAVNGHGHVIPRNDSKREGCGGVSICRQCKQAQSYFNAMKGQES